MLKQKEYGEQQSFVMQSDSGICEIRQKGQTVTEGNKIKSEKKPIKSNLLLIDPICLSCWGIEPQLRKLKLSTVTLLKLNTEWVVCYPMESYNGGGIVNHQMLPHHWDEVSVYYDMPIDGDVWLEDPLQSSYPPSIAVKKGPNVKDHEKAILF